MPDQDQIEEASHDVDMAELIRSTAGDALSAIPGIEQTIVELTKVLRFKIASFFKEDIEFTFSSMRMLDELSDEEVEKFLILRVPGEGEHRVALMLATPEQVRHVLMLLLGGKKASPSDFPTGELRGSEASLFLLFAEQMVSGLVEAADIVSNYGIPASPMISNRKEFRQFCNELELVTLEFSLGFEEDMKLIEFVVPLEVFDLIKLPDDMGTTEEPELSEEELWDAALGDHVENLKIPMGVELSSFEMSLSKLCSLQVGESFSVNSTKGGLRILDDEGVTAFIADLEIHNRKFGLRVAEQREKEEA